VTDVRVRVPPTLTPNCHRRYFPQSYTVEYILCTRNQRRGRREEYIYFSLASKLVRIYCNVTAWRRRWNRDAVSYTSHLRDSWSDSPPIRSRIANNNTDHWSIHTWRLEKVNICTSKLNPRSSQLLGSSNSRSCVPEFGCNTRTVQRIVVATPPKVSELTFLERKAFGNRANELAKPKYTGARANEVRVHCLTLIWTSDN
jgi:hypothetical protein